MFFFFVCLFLLLIIGIKHIFTSFLDFVVVVQYEELSIKV